MSDDADPLMDSPPSRHATDAEVRFAEEMEERDHKEAFDAMEKQRLLAELMAEVRGLREERDALVLESRDRVARARTVYVCSTCGHVHQHFHSYCKQSHVHEQGVQGGLEARRLI